MIPLNDQKRPMRGWKNRNGEGQNGWPGGLRPEALGPFYSAKGAGIACGVQSGDAEADHVVCLDADSPEAVRYMERLIAEVYGPELRTQAVAA